MFNENQNSNDKSRAQNNASAKPLKEKPTTGGGEIADTDPMTKDGGIIVNRKSELKAHLDMQTASTTKIVSNAQPASQKKLDSDQNEM